MFQKFTSKLILTILLGTNFIHAEINPSRCGTLGDSLNAEEAIARRSWAMKCFPQFRGQIKTNDQFLNTANGTKTEGYPALAFVDDNGDVSNPQKWFAPKNASAPCDYPNGYTIVAYCSAGCYTFDQELWFSGGHLAIAEARNSETSVMSLTESSSMENLQWQPSSIAYFILDIVPGWHDILVIKTASGGQLRVTKDHPLVDSNGNMRSASSLELGESLVKSDGSFDQIVMIMPDEYFGKVYNLDVTKTKLIEKIVVAQGFLNGSVYFQNIALKDLNRVVMRTNLITNELVE